MTNQSSYLFSLTYPEVEKLAPEFPNYRYAQLFNWIYKKRVFDLDRMTNIPGDFRNILKEKVIENGKQFVKKNFSYQMFRSKVMELIKVRPK